MCKAQRDSSLSLSPSLYLSSRFVARHDRYYLRAIDWWWQQLNPLPLSSSFELLNSVVFFTIICIMTGAHSLFSSHDDYYYYDGSVLFLFLFLFFPILFLLSAAISFFFSLVPFLCVSHVLSTLLVPLTHHRCRRRRRRCRHHHHHIDEDARVQ